MYSGSRLVSSSFAYGAFTLSGWLSQNHSAKLAESIPRSEPQHARTLVWALPVSLAATPGIDVSFSSSGYLDVSVHRVMILEEPGNYLKYYVGYLKFRQMREQLVLENKSFSVSAFHEAILRTGPSPFSVLEETVRDQLK